jgi:hypothetical protein
MTAIAWAIFADEHWQLRIGCCPFNRQQSAKAV